MFKIIYLFCFFPIQNATLGALALSFSSSMEKFSKQIRKLIMSQISHQMKSTSKLEISYLEGSFSGLNDLLVVFPFDLPRERPQLDALCDTIIKCSEFQIGKFFSLHRFSERIVRVVKILSEIVAFIFQKTKEGFTDGQLF